MKKYKYLIVLMIIIVSGLVVDLIAKSVFASILEYGENVIVVIPNLFKFVYVENRGAAYGMLSGRLWLLIILSLLFIGAFVCYFIFTKDKNMWLTVAVGLIISGAIGNLLDRMILGFVRDFISIEFFNFVFNIADMLITFGVICFFVYTLLQTLKEYKEKKVQVKNDETEDK